LTGKSSTDIYLPSCRKCCSLITTLRWLPTSCRSLKRCYWPVIRRQYRSQCTCLSWKPWISYGCYCILS